MYWFKLLRKTRTKYEVCPLQVEHKKKDSLHKISSKKTSLRNGLLENEPQGLCFDLKHLRYRTIYVILKDGH